MMNDRTFNGGRSYPIPVWNGIFEHQQEIGPALWVFLWCLDRITREESGRGFVLGGTVVTAARILEDLQCDSDRTVRRHLVRLAKHGYVELKRAPYGFTITVNNSRKFNIWGSDKSDHPDRTKMPVRSDKNAGQTDEIVRCIKEDSAVDSTQRQNLPPNPPPGGLTPRQLKDFSKELKKLAEASVGTGVSEDALIRTACLNLTLPLDQARKAVAQSVGEQSA